MPGGLPGAEQAVAEALRDTFKTAQEMSLALLEQGLDLAEDHNIHTGQRGLAVAVAKQFHILDPVGNTGLRRLLLAALNARRGAPALLGIAPHIGLVVPEHLARTPDRLLRLRVVENGGEYRVYATDEQKAAHEGISQPLDQVFESGLARLADVLVGSGAPHRGSLLDKGDRRFDEGLLRDLGNKVFEFLFPRGELHDFLRENQKLASDSSTQLQVMLDARQAPSLAHVPWELAFDPGRKLHFCLDPLTNITRHVAAEVTYARRTRELRFLGFIASLGGGEPLVPTDMLQTERERDLIRTALGRLDRPVKQAWSAAGTRAELGRLVNSRVPGDGWSVFHFIGHGGFDTEAQEGYLLFQGASGPVRVSAANLAKRLLVPGLTPQLVVLNCCSGGAAARGSRFSSVAESLALMGIPAVIAMQFPVSDDAALSFSQHFYGRICEGQSVRRALADARREMSDDYREWVTPALFTNSDDFALVEPDA